MTRIPFTSIDWGAIEEFESKGITGTSFCRAVELPGLRIRLIRYLEDFQADHWCEKGHFVQCLEGEFSIDLGNEESLDIRPKNGFVVSDEESSHRIRTKNGGTLLIVDGDFLKAEESGK